MMTVVSRSQRFTAQELTAASQALREILDLVSAGELEASTPRAVAMVRRLEGAVTAWEAAAGSMS
jgi:hypothetical protein